MGLELASHLPPFEGLLPKWLLLVCLQSHNQSHTHLQLHDPCYNTNL
jgi:hypothetical protein